MSIGPNIAIKKTIAMLQRTLLCNMPNYIPRNIAILLDVWILVYLGLVNIVKANVEQIWHERANLSSPTEMPMSIDVEA